MDKEDNIFMALAAIYTAYLEIPEISPSINLSRIGAEYGWDKKTSDQIIDRLIGDNFIRGRAAGGYFTLTENGVLRAERIGAGPNNLITKNKVIRARILDALSAAHEDGGSAKRVHYSQLSEELGLDQVWLLRNIRILQHLGYVKDTGVGTYRITLNGLDTNRVLHKESIVPSALEGFDTLKELDVRIQPEEPNQFGIFLCHAFEDKLAVRNLYEKLREDGYDPWLDEISLIPGQDWKLEISKAVRSSDVVLVCLSNHSVSKRGYVQKEIVTALDVADEQPEGTVFIVPVRLEDCKVPDRLDRWHWVNLFEEGGYQKLSQALQLHDRRVDAIQSPRLAENGSSGTDSSLPRDLDNVKRTIQELSVFAQQLLKEASFDPHGQILRAKSIGGLHIQSNGKDFVESSDPRTEAAWNGALRDLNKLGLVEDRGYKGEVFYVTDRGYEIADHLPTDTELP